MNAVSLEMSLLNGRWRLGLRPTSRVLGFATSSEMKEVKRSTGCAKSQVGIMSPLLNRVFIATPDLVEEHVKPYKVNDKTVNQAVLLKHGKSVRQFNMDRISNSEFSQVSEFSLMKYPLLIPYDRKNSTDWSVYAKRRT